MDYLQPDAVTENIEKQFALIRRLMMQYRRGRRTADECRKQLNNAIFDGYFEFIRKFLRFNLTQHNWDDFLEEYRKAEKEIPLAEAKSESWLNSQQWDDVNKVWVPASASDRTQVFRLMRAFHIPPEYHMPLPDNTPVSHVQFHISGGWKSCISSTISFECEDDGGLLSCDEPCGKTFTLENELGLKAVITIKDVYSETREILHNRGYADYQGEGYIEGYTEASFQREDPRLYIRVWKGKVIGFIAFLSDADRRAYRQYPIWQDYFRHGEATYTMFERVLDTFFENSRNFEGNAPNL